MIPTREQVLNAEILFLRYRLWKAKMARVRDLTLALFVLAVFVTIWLNRSS